MKLKMLNKKYQIALLVIAIMLIISGVSYAYFAVVAIGTSNNNIVTSGTMKITYTDGPQVSLDNAIPGDYLTKTFTVENTGNVDTSYDIYFSNILNEFEDKSDLVYSISSTNNGYLTSDNIQFPNTDSKIAENINISPGTIQEYSLTIYFLEKSENQDDNQGKNVNFKIQINGTGSSDLLCNASANDNWTYSYLGNVQIFTVPCTGSYNLEAWGASGYTYNNYSGYGAYTSGVVNLVKDQKIYVYVGGAGSTATSGIVSGGYNGGGNSFTYLDGNQGSGGGATDYRLNSSLNARIMVAAGGGGSVQNSSTNYGGALTSANAVWSNDPNIVAPSATQFDSNTYNSSNTVSVQGSFGYGANGDTNYRAGGGGGYYGGSVKNYVGAGGTSYVSGYLGSVAIESVDSTTPRSDSNGQECTMSSATGDITCSYHYSGLIFNNAKMIAGNASMPTHNGSSTMTGNAGNGYAKMTLVTSNDTSKCASGTIWNYSYTGNVQTFTSICSGTYKFESWGASGYSLNAYIGYGAYTSGNINLNENQKIYVYVGGAGSTATSGIIPGGYNGGGSSAGYSDNNQGSGGGATDFRLDSTVNSRIMVAAGGGGCVRYSTTNYGGTLTSANAIWAIDSSIVALGSTQVSSGIYVASAIGSFGQGANGDAKYRAGGGGGYYGGSINNYVASGGSSYVSGYLGCVAVKSVTLTTPRNDSLGNECTKTTASSDITCSYHYSNLIFTNIKMTAGNASMPNHSETSTMIGNAGNGYARITFIEKK